MRGAVGLPCTLAASAASMRSIRSAYGPRRLRLRCARRSLLAATIFMALVILRVDLTLLMRARSALRLAMRTQAANDLAKPSRKLFSLASVSGLMSRSARMLSMIDGSRVRISPTICRSNAPILPTSTLSR